MRATAISSVLGTTSFPAVEKFSRGKSPSLM